MGDGVGEAEHVGMQAKPVQRVVAVTVFNVSTYRMSHIGGVNANLVFASRFESILHERVLCGAVENVEVCHCIFPSVIHRRRVGDVGLVVLQPVGYRSPVVHHLPANYCHISAVIDNVVPVVLENLLRLHVLRIHHQSACVAVEPVYHMGATFLATLAEIVVEHALHVQRRVSRSHRENTHVFLHNNEPSVLIYYLHISALESRLVALRLAHGNFHARLQQKVKLCDAFSVHLYSPSLQSSLHLCSALAQVCKQELKQRFRLFHDQVFIVSWPVISIVVFHFSNTFSVFERKVTKNNSFPQHYLHPFFAYSCKINKV